MADIKFSQLTTASVFAGTDIYALVADGGNSRQVRATAVFTQSFKAVGQLAFPATQLASSDANTLDDYEEGTWTPTLTCGTSGTITLNNSFGGTYTKIGNRVMYSALCVVSSVSSPLGGMTVNNLPFTSANQYQSSCIMPNALAAGATGQIVGRCNASNSTIQIYRYAAGALTDDMATQTQASSEYYINGHFNV